MVPNEEVRAVVVSPLGELVDGRRVGLDRNHYVKCVCGIESVGEVKGDKVGVALGQRAFQPSFDGPHNGFHPAF